MSGFKKLVEISDKAAREELGNYYIVSESRINNMIQCLEEGAKQIQSLREENIEMLAALEDAVYQMERVCDDCEQWIGLKQAQDVIQKARDDGRKRN